MKPEIEWECGIVVSVDAPLIDFPISTPLVVDGDHLESFLAQGPARPDTPASTVHSV